MGYSIVDIEKKHLDELVIIEQECFSVPWTRSQLETEMPDDRHVFIAAVSESGSVLGYVGMTYVVDEGYISNVAVKEDFRRRGLADALLDALEMRARALELAFTTLEVRESNNAAIALYKKHGYSAAGRRKNYYDLPDEDAILMTKILK